MATVQKTPGKENAAASTEGSKADSNESITEYTIVARVKKWTPNGLELQAQPKDFRKGTNGNGSDGYNILVGEEEEPVFVRANKGTYTLSCKKGENDCCACWCLAMASLCACRYLKFTVEGNVNSGKFRIKSIESL